MQLLSGRMPACSASSVGSTNVLILVRSIILNNSYVVHRREMGRYLGLSTGFPGFRIAMVFASLQIDGTTPVEWQYVNIVASQVLARGSRFFRSSGKIPSTPAALPALVVFKARSMSDTR